MKNCFKRLIAITLVCLVVFLSFGINASAGTTKISVVWSNPGEDCSKEVMFSWQSTNSKSDFYFVIKGEDFGNGKMFKCEGTKTEYFTTYSYKLAIDGLEPATTYQYKIASGDAETVIYEVTTASVASSFNFAWFSDMHVHTGSPNRVTYANDLLQKITTESGGYDMILVTGDEVSNGGNYSCYDMLTDLRYNPTLQTTMWACVPGNHSYYSETESKLVTNQFYEAMTNHPKNGYDEKSSSFWFLYNSVLFVGMDSLTIQNSSTTISAQQTWFRKVVEQNEGRYQYLIVFQHYPWLNALTGALAAGYYSGYKAWYEIFDEYNVDLALAGDYHTYYRSNKLYQNKPVSIDNPNGTVYMGARQIGGRAGGNYGIHGEQNPEYFACRLHNEEDTTSGAGFFTVTSEGIEWKMYDHKTMSLVDSMFLPAKRSINWGKYKDVISDSTFFTSAGTTGYVNFNTTYKYYVDTMTVKNSSGNVLATVNPALNNKATAILTGLTVNTAFDLKVEYEFADGTKKEVTINANTYGNFGEVYGFNVTSLNGKLNASFNYDLKNNIISKFEIYQDNQLLDTYNLSDNSGVYNKTLDSAKLDLNATYKLVGKNSKGEIIFNANKQYTFYGDLDFDGEFDYGDVDASFDIISTGKSLDGNALLLNDFNDDGSFDIGDVIMIYKALKDNKTSIKANVYTVVYLDFDGNVASTQEVKEGENATTPTFANVSGYTFEYLSASDKKVSSDVVIKAVYKAN